MAIGNKFLSEWIAEHGSWAYHICSGESSRVCVLAEGLKPVGEDVRGWSAQIDESLASRPGHVYLCIGKGLALIAEQSFGGWSPEKLSRLQNLAARAVVVDLRTLDAANISPDEDCCFESTLTLECEAESLPMPGSTPPDFTVRDRFSVEGGLETPEVFAQRPYASYGEWAEAQNIGADLNHTAECFATFGSVAYRGHIPACALRACTVQELQVLAQDLLVNTTA
jgi:hypothetical protein